MSRTVRILALLCTLPAVIGASGFGFHTSFDPAVLGKWSWAYFAFLCAWTLITVPASYLFGRWLFDTQTIRLARGRTAAVRPRTKIAWLIVIGLPLAVVLREVVVRRLTETTATVHTEIFHPYLQNIPKPSRDTYTINEWGFRGEEIKRRKPEGTYRIVVLGGSTVFCGDVPWERTHCRLLEKRLREARPGRTIEVLNAGVDWHSSAHSLIKLLTWVQDFDPDLIIAYHAVNDLLRGLTPDRFAAEHYRADYGHYYGPVANFVNPGGALRDISGMYLGYWCSDFRMDRVRVLGPYGHGIKGAKILFFPKSEPVEIDKFKSLAAFRRNMTDLVEIARAKSFDVILASQPYLYRDDLDDRERSVIWFPCSHHDAGTRPSIASMAAGMDRFNAAARKIAEAHDVAFVDLASMMPRTLEYFYDDVHYTEKGNEVVARAFFDEIVTSGRLGDAPSP